MRLGLQFIFKEENIEVSEEELQQEIAATAAGYPEAEQAKVLDEYKKNRAAIAQLGNEIMLEKLFVKLLGAL